MKLYLELKRTKPARQHLFPFYERSQRRLRRFKLGIITLTGLAIAIILAAQPKGRYLVASVPPLGARPSGAYWACRRRARR